MTYDVIRYSVPLVIRSFRDKEAERIFRREVSRRLPTAIQPVALRKLRMIHHAQSLDDLRVPPANRLEKLGGDRAGTRSIRVNERWRICFRGDGRDAADVEIVDYH